MVWQIQIKGGKPGWVQVVSGKPCARQPGQKSTLSVFLLQRASMSDAERKSAQEREKQIQTKGLKVVLQNQLMQYSKRK